MEHFLEDIFSPTSLLFYFFGYFVGATPTFYWVARILNRVSFQNLKAHSQTAAHMWRTISKRSGAFVFLLDILKGIVPCAIAYSFELSPEVIALIGLLVVIGHCYSLWIQFHGGRGAAPAAGALLFVFWPASVIGILLFLFLVLMKVRAGYASLTSVLVGYAMLFISDVSFHVQVIFFLTIALVIWRHHSHIKRILRRS